MCCKTGGPAGGTIVLRTRAMPAWTWILLFFGVLPFLVAWVFAGVDLAGRLPISRDALDKASRVKQIGWGGGLIAAGTFIAALALDAPWLTPLAAAGLVIAVAAGVALWWYIPDARPLDQGRRVEILHVHRDFVDTVRAESRTG
jgi:hypothetical protein